MSKVNIEQLSQINNLEEKTYLASTDLFVVEDSQSSYDKNKFQVNNFNN